MTNIVNISAKPARKRFRERLSWVDRQKEGFLWWLSFSWPSRFKPVARFSAFAYGAFTGKHGLEEDELVRIPVYSDPGH